MKNHVELDYNYHQVIAEEYDSIVVAPREITNDHLFKQFSYLIKPSNRMLAACVINS